MLTLIPNLTQDPAQAQVGDKRTREVRSSLGLLARGRPCCLTKRATNTHAPGAQDELDGAPPGGATAEWVAGLHRERQGILAARQKRQKHLKEVRTAGCRLF